MNKKDFTTSFSIRTSLLRSFLLRVLTTVIYASNTRYNWAVKNIKLITSAQSRSLHKNFLSIFSSDDLTFNPSIMLEIIEVKTIYQDQFSLLQPHHFDCASALGPKLWLKLVQHS